MKQISVISMVLLFIIYGLIMGQDNNYKVELFRENVSNYDITAGRTLYPEASEWFPPSPYKEKLINHPENYKVKYTYFLSLQTYQTTYLCMNIDEKTKKRTLDSVWGWTFEDWQSRYTLDSLDCIVSACILEDSSGNEYMIFDKNNDEDFSNDQIIEFQEDAAIGRPYADSEVEFEYYDGKEIKKGKKGIRIKRAKIGTGAIIPQSLQAMFGEVKLDGIKYKIGITFEPGPDIECPKYNTRIWFDLNHDNKYSQGDYYESMYRPVTIKEKSYKVTEVDRFGKSVTISLLNKDTIPPIGAGLPAPDFSETALDSTEFRLSDYKGKYVILDFWTCNANLNLPIISKVYDEFRENDDVKIITFGLYDEKYLNPELKNIKINWLHVNKFDVSGTRELYQASSKHETFLINPEGIILGKKIFAEADTIINMVKKNLD